jgi:hypothetical protein
MNYKGGNEGKNSRPTDVSQGRTEHNIQILLSREIRILQQAELGDDSEVE